MKINHKMTDLQECIISRLDLTKQMSEEEVWDSIDEAILKESRTGYLGIAERGMLRREIFYTIRRLGILQELLEDPEITEIMVNGIEAIFLEKAGQISRCDIRFETEEKLFRVIQQIAADCNRVVNESSPIMDARLKDGSRVNVVLSPVALNGPVLTIRRFPEKPITMETLKGTGSVSEEAGCFLQSAVLAGCNILISGGTGSGKTTFLNALSEWIPSKQRVITIEDSAELQLQGLPNLIRLETRNANVEGCREITIRDLIKTSLRMRPDRIIVGEVRGKEAIDMLQSINVGHSAMTTVHANSVREVVSRLETMVLMGMEIPLSAVRKQIISGFDLMIHVGRLRDGSRRVLEIAEPVEGAVNEAAFHTLYQFEETGETITGKVIGRLIKRGELQRKEKLKAAGMFKEKN